MLAVSTSDSLNTNAGVFGTFATLPEYRPITFHTAHALVKELTILDAACTEVLKDFTSYLSANPRVPSLVVENARHRADGFPTHVQSLYKLILIRKSAWKRAETFAEVVFRYAQRMSLVLREGLQLFLTAERIIERGVFPDPKFTPADVTAAVAHSRKGMAELSWTIKELMEFQALATKWYRALQDEQVDRELPTCTSVLVKLVQGLVDWTDDATELASRLRSKRKTIWARIVGTPFEQRHLISGMLYRFGCPHANEEPKGLRGEYCLHNCEAHADQSIDALSHAKTIISQPSTPIAEDQGEYPLNI